MFECVWPFCEIGTKRVKEGDSSIVISQTVDSIESLKLGGKKDNKDLLNETEIHNPCALIGQFNWLATQTRPDILFECCNLRENQKSSHWWCQESK